MSASEKIRFRAVARGPADVRDGGGRGGDCGEALSSLILSFFSWAWALEWEWESGWDGVWCACACDIGVVGAGVGDAIYAEVVTRMATRKPFVTRYGAGIVGGEVSHSVRYLARSC